MSKKWRVLTIPLLLATLSVGITPSIAASTLGEKCTKVNTFTLIGKKVAICSKKGSKLIWTLVTPAQKIIYQKQQIQLEADAKAKAEADAKAKAEALVIGRKKTITDLQNTKNQYSNMTNYITPLNTSLIEARKILIEDSRNLLIDLQKQKETTQQTKITNQNNLTSIVSSINSAQNSINSLANQISNQQNTVNYSKVNNDSSYNTYISDKAQSDYLSYSYQRALSDNSAMLTAKVLCDFGFGNCGIFSAAQYNSNASTISQYNAASARTAGAYASYATYSSQYSSNLNVLNSLKSQQAQFNSSVTSLNAQKSLVSAHISVAESGIARLEFLINQSLAKFAPLEIAEKRIKQDLQKYSEIKGLIEIKSAELIVAIDTFLQVADETFILNTSVTNWDNQCLVLANIQKDIESKVVEIKALTTALESFLSTL